MQTLQNEHTITTFANCVTLTTHRIRYNAKTADRHDVIGIMLNEVSSCAMMHTSNPLLLVLAVILFIGGIIASMYSDLSGPWIFGVVLAGVFIFAYFASRRQLLSVASAGASIRVAIAGNNVAATIKFIDTIEEAKNACYFATPRNTATVAGQGTP